MSQIRLGQKKAVAIIVLIFTLALILNICDILNQLEAHISAPTKRIQEWIDKADMIRIQFLYQPEMPIIDEFTELQFSIQNMSTGKHIKDLTGRVTVTNGQRLLKFENISVPDGDFSVKYLFPDDGTHQVLLRLNGKNKLTEIASFKVFVPHQGASSVLDPLVGDKIFPTIIIGAILARVLVITIVMLKKRK